MVINSNIIINDEFVINLKLIICDFGYCMAQIRNKTLLNAIAKKVKALREKKGLTQEEFYNDTNIHVGRIENASTDVRISTLEAICKYFKISLSEFFKDLK